MKMRKSAIILYILVVAMLLPLGTMAADTTSNGLNVAGYVTPWIEGVDDPKLSISITYKAGETLYFTLTDARTGRSWSTTPSLEFGDLSTATQDNKKIQNSQIIASYTYRTAGDREDLEAAGYKSATTGTLYSYDDCILKDQATIFAILADQSLVALDAVAEDAEVIGYRVNYALGQGRPYLYPRAISATRFNEWLAKIETMELYAVNSEGKLKLDKDGNPYIDPNRPAALIKQLKNKYELISKDKIMTSIERELRNVTDEAEYNKRKEALIAEKLAPMLEKYPILAKDDMYLVYTSAENTNYKIKMMVSYWGEANYTYEDLVLDNGIVGYEEAMTGISMTIPVEYVVEGNTFRATILTDEIVLPAEVMLTRVDLLPGFAAADTDVENGYILVPDGSGAILPINAEDTQFIAYQGAVMNRLKDEALSNYLAEDPSYYEAATLPVFGQKQDENAWFAIIENGYEFANINAEISSNFTKYNRTYASFFLSPSDMLFYSAQSDAGIQRFPTVEREEIVELTERRINAETGEMEVITTEVEKTRVYADLPNCDMTVRYQFLSDSEEGKAAGMLSADYAGMSSYFRTYLMNTYGMERLAAKDNVTFYTDLYGIIDKKVNFLGFPSNTKYALTDFKEAESIVNALKDNGVNDLTVRYLGIANGGLVQTYSNEFVVEKNLGGSKGYKQFLENMASLGVDVYPDVDITHVFKDKMMDGFSTSKDVVMTLGKTSAIVTELEVSTGRYMGTEAFFRPRWIVSPRNFETLFNGFKTSLSKYNNANISFGVLGSTLSADFNEDYYVDRSETARLIAQQLASYQEDGYNVMVNRGFYHTIPYVDTILDIPLTSSQYTIQDYEVPFMQMVLHGLVEYAGEPMNVTQEVQYSIMKSLETGAMVYARFIYEPDTALRNTAYESLYSLHYANWLETAQEIYTKVNEAIGDVNDQFIVNHERLAESVYRTTYESGKQVIVNYSVVDYVDSTAGITVPANNYLVMGEVE